MPYLGVLCSSFEKLLPYLKSTHLYLSNCKISCKNKNETKNALFGYFWNEDLKNYGHILNRRPQIRLIEKFPAKAKILNFGTKNVLFGCFGQ